jgi:tRNA-dihydrouridine synthase B
MKIGNIHIENGVLLAPMEDVTDIPFRLICKRLGADILYTEFINSEGLIRLNERTHKKMMFLEEERPIAIQIYGGEIPSMEGAAKLAESLQPDFIDINCGCWVKNVALRGAGAGLLRDLPKMEKIAQTVVNATRLPVTLKTRLGWDLESVRILEVAKMCEDSGIQALTVHCRTRKQGHRGEVDWSWIKRLKDTVSIPIIANGDITRPEHAKYLFAEMGADAVMIGRGAIENPWIFGEIKEYLATGIIPEPATPVQRIQLCIHHLRLAAEYKGDRKGVIEMRKHYSGYLRGMKNAAKVRAELMQWSDLDPVVERLHGYIEEQYEYAV